MSTINPYGNFCSPYSNPYSNLLDYSVNPSWQQPTPPPSGPGRCPWPTDFNSTNFGDEGPTGALPNLLEAFGTSGDDTQIKHAGAGNDTIRMSGGKGRDIQDAQGGAGNDTIRQHGGKGNDTVVARGGAGNDTIYQRGNHGNDTTFADGGAGNDSFDVGVGRGKNRAILNGGQGQDSATILAGKRGVTVIGANGEVIYKRGKGKGGSTVHVKSIEDLKVTNAKGKTLYDSSDVAKDGGKGLEKGKDRFEIKPWKDLGPKGHRLSPGQTDDLRLFPARGVGGKAGVNV